MEYVLQDRKVAVIHERLHSGSKYRIGDAMVFISSTNTNKLLNQLLVESITGAKNSDERKLEHLETLAKHKLFDMLVIKNVSYTLSVASAHDELDAYIRYSNIQAYQYLSGEVVKRDGVRSHYLRDDSANTVVGTIPNKLTALPHLRDAGMLLGFEIVELPWVHDFHFTQPRHSAKPLDFKKNH